MKMRKQFNRKCSRKQLTMGEVKALAQKKDTPKENEVVGNNATAIVTNETTEYTPEVNDLFENLSLQDNEHSGLGFQNNMAKVEIIQNKKIDYSALAAKAQTRFHYWSSKDPKAMKQDKKCIVCHKRNMDWPRYSAHLEDKHDIYQDEDDRKYIS